MRLFLLSLTVLWLSPVLGQKHYEEPDSAMLWLMRSQAASQEWDLWVNEIAAINNETIADEYGEYDDWVEIFNYGDEPVDLNGAYVSDNPNNPTKHQLIEDTPGQFVIEPGEFLLLWCDDQPEQGAHHVTFSLSGSGEYFGIYTPDDVILIDGIEFGQQISDVTYGRTLDGVGWNFFPEPTPLAPNDSPGLFGYLPMPEFSYNDAFISGPTFVSIGVFYPGAEIRYTLDGSTPTDSSALYVGPVEISETTMLRARAFKEDYLPSAVATNTFIAEDDFSLDIISLVTDDHHIWGSTGIYDNRFSGLEKPIHIEYFTNDGTLEWEIDGGMKIHAPDTRPQQSLRLYARSNYGYNQIDHQIFPMKDVHWFKRLVLRNGANDGQQLARTHFRDVMAHKIFSEIDDDNIYAAFKPVNVYLNGEYWGMYNLRERQDRWFIESNYGFTDVDFLERVATTPDSRDQKAGDWEDYDAMRDYLMQNDMADEEHYAVIEDWIDIRNYVDYMVTEIWTANRDWLSNNIKYYRPRNMPETKWKWILWDTEYGMGCYPNNDHGNPNFDALHMAMTWGGWPPHWGIQNSTYMMNNLKDNPGFVEYFITRHADLLNSWLRTDRVQEQIDYFKELYGQEIQKQIDRWAYSLPVWNNAVQILENWNAPRAHWCRQHIMNKWDHVESEHVITLNVEPDGAGTIKVNTIFTDENPWSGYYFKGVPVNLTAVPNTGYQFVEWVETGLETHHIEIWMESDSTFTALFEPSNEIPAQIVINEINYKSAPFLDTEDWVELTNAGQVPVLMENWEFRDDNDNNQYVFGPGTWLAPGEFLILAEDPIAFLMHNPNVSNVHGPFDFGFSSNGELLRLYNDNLELMDHVFYGVNPPWPTTPNGLGPTLELIDPLLDNTLAQNWFARPEPGGTPGEPNTFVTSLQKQSNDLFVRVFPNPSDGNFYIQISPNDLPLQLDVYNGIGQMVESVQIQETLHLLNIQGSAGLYVARFESESGAATLRMVKK